MDRLRQDLRYALRRLTLNPGFAAIAILSLAIGIGANTAIFTVVNVLFIRPPPGQNTEGLVEVYTFIPGASPFGNSSYPDFLQVRELDQVFTEVGAFEAVFSRIELGEGPEPVMAEAVSPNLFPMLGVTPAYGRGFLPEEGLGPGEHPVVILGHSFWERAYGGDPTVLGRTLRLAGRPFTVVGIAPERFQSLSAPGLRVDLFVPLVMSAVLSGPGNEGIYQAWNNQRFSIKARLAPGVSLPVAGERLRSLATRLGETRPDRDSRQSFRLKASNQVAIAPELDGALALAAAFLMTVVGLVLLLACTNLAGFLLARGIERRKEVAIRLALGARRRRLVSQLLTETTLLALLGGAAGLLVAHAALKLLMGFHPPLPVSFNLDFGLDGNVFFFALGISTLAGLFFGLFPAIKTTRPDLAPTLKNESGTGRRKGLSLRNSLVAAQVAVSTVLLVGGSLFLRSLWAAQAVDVGFSAREGGVIWVDLQVGGIPRDQWGRVTADLDERARALPGIDRAATSHSLPLSLGGSFQTFSIQGVETSEGAPGHRIPFARVSPGYFETLGIPLVAGRAFTDADGPNDPGVVVVSRAFAERFWPGENPIGKEIGASRSRPPLQVVGTVGDTKVFRLGELPQPFVYLPQARQPSNDVYLVAAGTADPGAIVGMLRQMVREADPNLVVMEAKTLREHLSVILFPPRMAALLLGVFGLLGLALAVTGLYGMVSFTVSRRTREVGIRMSLGANHTAVVGSVLKEALSLVAVGTLVGLALAFPLTHLVRHFLIGVSPADPMTLVGVPLLLLAVAVAAAFVPARRASRVNPVEALRSG